mgnify:CR=1 FL=1
MIKHISIIHRPAHFTHEEAVTYWKEVHQNVVKLRLPGLVKYVANFPVEYRAEDESSPDGRTQMTCDAIVELHFKDLESLKRGLSSASYNEQERVDSSHRFIDFSRLRYAIMEEVEVPVPGLT